MVERKRRGSPAVTLLVRKPKEISVDIILALESKSSWPASTKGGLPISNWLGAKVRNNLRRQPFYLVPKHAKEGSGFQGILTMKVNLKDVHIKESLMVHTTAVKDQLVLLAFQEPLG